MDGASLRTVRIFEHISLDGVIQLGGDRDGDFAYRDWTAPYRTPDGAQSVAEAQDERFDRLLGRLPTIALSATGRSTAVQSRTGSTR
jgi:hypothetical protein